MSEREREISVWNISNALNVMNVKLLRMLYVLFLGQEDMCRMIIKFSKSCAWKWNWNSRKTSRCLKKTKIDPYHPLLAYVLPCTP